MAIFQTAHKNYLSACGCPMMMMAADGDMGCDGCGGKCGLKASCDGGCSGCPKRSACGVWHPASFESSQEKVKKAEGGYSDDARDPGNYTGNKIGVGSLIGTKWGIAAPTLKRFLGYEPTKKEMQSLPYETAVKIYRKEYWAPIKGDAIKDQKLADMIYDSAVNQGAGKAIKYVKDSLGIASYDVKKINEANPDKLFRQIGAKRKADYDKLGGYAHKSWMNRLKDLGYTIEKHKGKAIMGAIGITLIAGGIIYYNKSN